MAALLGNALAGPGDPLSVSNLGDLLGALKLDLNNPLELANLIDEVPGVNVVTTGPLFTLLKLLGVDIGWVPPLPNSVTGRIDQHDYLTVRYRRYSSSPMDSASSGAPASCSAAGAERHLPDVASVRLIPVVGTGLGAFAAGAAYQQVVDDLENQPGGENGPSSLLGSYTVLPMVLLLLRPGRANGGPLARM